MILLGVATTAAAEPKQEETSGRVSLKENGEAKNAPRAPGEWVELATPTPAKHGTEFVIVGKEAGYFARLRVDPSKGKTIVRRVKVVFDDGTILTVRPDKTLSQGKQPLLVELGDSKAIERIVVTTETHTTGEYAIYGSSGGGVVGSR